MNSSLSESKKRDMDSDTDHYEEEEESCEEGITDMEEDSDYSANDQYESRAMYVQSLPPDVQGRVRELQMLQEKKNEIQQDYLNDLQKLQKKYEDECEPLYERRRAIIEGKLEPDNEAVKKGFPEEHFQYISLVDGEHTSELGIPNFWLNALIKIPLIQLYTSERDKEALSHLLDIRCKSNSSSPSGGFILYFEFSANPFFSETVLTKEYIKKPCAANGLGEWYLADIKGSAITWKSNDNNLTLEETRKKQRNKKTNEIRFTTIFESCDSFFNFFSAPSFPSSMRSPGEVKEAENNSLDEDLEEEELEDLIEEDWDMALSIKECVIPRAVDFFAAGPSSENEFEGEYPEEDFEENLSEDLTNQMISQSGLGSEKDNENSQNQECKQQ